MSNAITARAAHLLGCEVRRAEPVHGGDLSTVLRLHLAPPGTVVAKHGSLVAVEGRMLAALTAAGASAPEVLAQEGDLLLMSDLGPGGAPGPKGWQALAETLRQLHATGGPAYGWDEDYAFGAVPIPNAWRQDWPTFWAEHRLQSPAAALDATLRARIDRLSARLPDMLPAAPPAALLHGDLWSGNIVWSTGGCAGLIDPACYHGDAEVDLAMLTLFGQPPPAFWDTYGPLAPGWQDRRAIHQLWPALVHLRLFGSGYRGMVTGLLDRLSA